MYVIFEQSSRNIFNAFFSKYVLYLSSLEGIYLIHFFQIYVIFEHSWRNIFNTFFQIYVLLQPSVVCEKKTGKVPKRQSRCKSFPQGMQKKLLLSEASLSRECKRNSTDCANIVDWKETLQECKIVLKSQYWAWSLMKSIGSKGFLSYTTLVFNSVLVGIHTLVWISSILVIVGGPTL